MKLIRLTDTRYLLDAGDNISAADVEQIQKYWIDWWRKDTGVPTVIIVGSVVHPLEYEDRREPDIESRLRFLENHIHGPGTGIISTKPLEGEPDAQDQDQD